MRARNIRDFAAHRRPPMTKTAGPPPVFIEALGSCLRLEIEDVGLREAIAGLWADLRIADEREAPAATHRVVVTGDGPWHITDAEGRARATTTMPETVSEVCAAINAPLAAGGPMLAAHCAVVTRSDVTLVIPGVSGAGKSTLTVALLQRGWRYVSDEALALDWESGSLAAYPRPLGISEWTAGALGVSGGMPGFGEIFVRAAELGASIERRPGSVTHLVLPRRDGAAEPRLSSVHRMKALEALMHRGFNFYKAPTTALPVIADLVRRADVFTFSYGAPGVAADFLTAELTGGAGGRARAASDFRA